MLFLGDELAEDEVDASPDPGPMLSSDTLCRASSLLEALVTETGSQKYINVYPMLSPPSWCLPYPMSAARDLLGACGPFKPTLVWSFCNWAGPVLLAVWNTGQT